MNSQKYPKFKQKMLKIKQKTNFINPAPPSQLTKNVSFHKQEKKVLIPATAEKKMA